MPSNAFTDNAALAALDTQETVATFSAGNYAIKVNVSNLEDDEELFIEVYNKLVTGDDVDVNREYSGWARSDQTDNIVSIPITVTFQARLKLTQINGTLRANRWVVIDLAG